MKTIKNLIAILFLAAALFIPVKAQLDPPTRVSVEGSIVHNVTGEPYANIRVDLENGSGVVMQTAYTTNKGAWNFGGIAPNTAFTIRPDNTHSYSGISYYYTGGFGAGHYCCLVFLLNP